MLVDTSILARLLQPHHSLYQLADSAIRSLRAQGELLYVVPQNLVELWVVATRPTKENGLGMSPEAIEANLAWLKSRFILLPDPPSIFAEWENLVATYRVSGKLAHDARLVAAMRVHGIKSILSFDLTGFARYRHITCVQPGDIS